MRVRVWIGGAEGPSRDFELANAPQVGECISIAVGGRLEEGIVTSVTWQLVGVERSSADMALGIEPVGSVTLVHVICHSSKTDDARAKERASAEQAEAT